MLHFRAAQSDVRWEGGSKAQLVPFPCVPDWLGCLWLQSAHEISVLEIKWVVLRGRFSSPGDSCALILAWYK